MRSILAVAAAFLTSCGGGEAPSSDDSGDSAADPQVSAPAGPVDGAEVYARNCAVCHGVNGDGDGELKLDRPARSFRAGGFSFGNTQEAILRTVTNGIGGTPMAGFVDVLSPTELEAVTLQVIALGPERVEVDVESMVLTVGAHAEVVRGGLPPLTDGGPVVPRGLLLGNADGTSFEYDASDVRLLAVRQGQFVRRRDWQNRGGDLLEPLGQVIWRPADGAAGAVAWLGTETPLHAQLAWTEVQGGQAQVGSRLLDAAGTLVATMSDEGSALMLGGLSGVRRIIRIEDGEPGAQILVRIAPTVQSERLGEHRLRLGTAGVDLVVVEAINRRGFVGLTEADGAIHAALKLDARGSASCEIDLIPVASAEDAEKLRLEDY